MGKSISDTLADVKLDYLKANGDRLYICSAEPTTFVEASATFNLGTVTLSASDYTGPADYAGGRKLDLAIQSVTIASPGTITHLAIADFGNSALLNVTISSAGKVVVATDIINTPVYEYRSGDPT